MAAPRASLGKLFLVLGYWIRFYDNDFKFTVTVVNPDCFVDLFLKNYRQVH